MNIVKWPLMFLFLKLLDQMLFNCAFCYNLFEWYMAYFFISSNFLSRCLSIRWMFLSFTYFYINGFGFVLDSLRDGLRVCRTGNNFSCNVCSKYADTSPRCMFFLHNNIWSCVSCEIMSNLYSIQTDTTVFYWTAYFIF